MAPGRGRWRAAGRDPRPGLLALVRGSPRLAGLGLPAARYPGRMDQIDSAAAEAKVLDLDGKEHALRELWAGRTAVLVFLRHFG